MIGKTVGHYRITSKLGAGGMGEVFLAEDTRLERKAAIKFLPAEFASVPERRERFFREAKAASALNHPHVCVVYDVGETDDGLPFIAMEYVEGRSLDEVVKQGPLEVARIVGITVQVADALDAAHARRIVHRDIKPANISLNERGQVKVLDFGLAKRLPQESGDALEITGDMQQTQQGQVLGTPHYMSPEQALGRDVDHRSDLFSLGAVIYCLLTGRSPFSGGNMAEVLQKVLNRQPDSLTRLNYEVPPELERITLKLLAKDVNRRYQSARDLMVDLRNLARDLEQGAGASGSAMSDRVEVTQSFAGERVGLATESFSLEKLRTSDVLLNYATIDDYPLQEGKPGWVSQLHRNLEVRMEQLSGEKVRIARLPEDAISPAIEGELLQHVPQAKAMISVVSPPFVNSEVCRREVEQFWQGAERTGGRFIKDKARLLKVLKTSVSEQQMPRQLVDIFSPLFGFEFFELDADTGRVREFDETFGPVARDVETMVRDCLARCTIAIHLLGNRYGVTPEDSSESIPALQVRLTGDPTLRPDLQRLIWMPGGGESADERQRAFVRRVQEDPALHDRAEIIEGNLNLLKKDLIRRLAPPEEKPKPAAPARSPRGAPKLYLICDAKDEPAVEALEDYLFAQGLEVSLPAFDGNDADAAALHQDNLLTCNGVLIYYGAAPKAWVDIKLRELLKATGYGREAPIDVQAVYIAPPDDRRKERFQSHQAEVIRQPGQFEPCAELDRFVSRIQEVCA